MRACAEARAPTGVAVRLSQVRAARARARECHRIFAGRWATDLSKFDPNGVPGTPSLARTTVRCSRPQYARGRRSRRWHDDPGAWAAGGHAYASASSSSGAARILAIESNVEAYLKCLIVKEALGIGRAPSSCWATSIFISRAARIASTWCSACGVLYHMEDPLMLIRASRARPTGVSSGRTISMSGSATAAWRFRPRWMGFKSNILPRAVSGPRAAGLLGRQQSHRRAG